MSARYTHEPPRRGPLHDQIAGGREHAAARVLLAADGDAPALGLRDRVVRDQELARRERGQLGPRAQERVELRALGPAAADRRSRRRSPSSRRFKRAGRPAVERLVHDHHALLARGDVGEPGRGTERHRLPVVRAGLRGEHDRRLVLVDAPRARDRTAARVDRARPVHEHERLGRDELAGLAVEHVEEAVLRRLHDHLARGARRSSRSARIMFCVAV